MRPEPARLRAVLASVMALASLSATTWASSMLLPGFAGPALATSMGAAAVLMFAAPDSPLATWRAFVLGNLVSAVIGVVVFRFCGDTAWAGGLAVALAIAAMHLLRCQHPPGGATALMAVIGGQEVHRLGFVYVAAPIGINLAIVSVFVLAHRWLLKRMG